MFLAVNYPHEEAKVLAFSLKVAADSLSDGELVS